MKNIEGGTRSLDYSSYESALNWPQSFGRRAFRYRFPGVLGCLQKHILNSKP